MHIKLIIVKGKLSIEKLVLSIATVGGKRHQCPGFRTMRIYRVDNILLHDVEKGVVNDRTT